MLFLWVFDTQPGQMASQAAWLPMADLACNPSSPSIHNFHHTGDTAPSRLPHAGASPVERQRESTQQRAEFAQTQGYPMSVSLILSLHTSPSQFLIPRQRCFWADQTGQNLQFSTSPPLLWISGDAGNPVSRKNFFRLTRFLVLNHFSYFCAILRAVQMPYSDPP